MTKTTYITLAIISLLIGGTFGVLAAICVTLAWDAPRWFAAAWGGFAGIVVALSLLEVLDIKLIRLFKKEPQDGQ